MDWEEPDVLDQTVLHLIGRHSPNPGPVDNAGDELVVDDPIAVDYACGDGAEELGILGKPFRVPGAHRLLAVPGDLPARQPPHDDVVGVERKKGLDVTGVVRLDLTLDDGLR